MFCPFCGGELSGDAAFCAYCGNYVAGFGDGAPSGSPQKRRRWPWIAGACGLFAAAAIVLLLLVFGLPGPEPAPASWSPDRAYRAYGALVAEYEAEYGALSFEEKEAPWSSMARGVCYLQLLDFDGDGVEELVVVLSSGDYGYWTEIWTCTGDEPVRAFDGVGVYTGDGESFALFIQRKNSRYVLYSVWNGTLRSDLRGDSFHTSREDQEHAPSGGGDEFYIPLTALSESDRENLITITAAVKTTLAADP